MSYLSKYEGYQLTTGAEPQQPMSLSGSHKLAKQLREKRSVALQHVVDADPMSGSTTLRRAPRVTIIPIPVLPPPHGRLSLHQATSGIRAEKIHSLLEQGTSFVSQQSVAYPNDEYNPPGSSNDMHDEANNGIEAVDDGLPTPLEDRQPQGEDAIRHAAQTAETHEARLVSLKEIQPLASPWPAPSASIIEPGDKLENFANMVLANVLKIRRQSHTFVNQDSRSKLSQETFDLLVDRIVHNLAAEARFMHPEYTGNSPASQRAEAVRISSSPMFKIWHGGGSAREDGEEVEYLSKGPLMYFKKYPAFLEKQLVEDNPQHVALLTLSFNCIRRISYIAQLEMWHALKARGAMAGLEWHHSVGPERLKRMEEREKKRQSCVRSSDDTDT
jgi:hypothetical protein